MRQNVDLICPSCGNKERGTIEDILDEGVFFCHGCGRYVLPITRPRKECGTQ